LPVLTRAGGKRTLQSPKPHLLQVPP